MADTYRAVGSLLFNETQDRKLATCEDMATAQRLAKALGLQADIERGWRVHTDLCPEAEIMQRARHIATAAVPLDGWPIEDLGKQLSAIIKGDYDQHPVVLAAARALRDLAKPLSELAPAVDPDLLEARRIAVEAQGKAIISPGLNRQILEGRNDGCPLVQASLAAIKRGRELERKACATIAAAPFGQQEGQRLGDQLRAGLDR